MIYDALEYHMRFLSFLDSFQGLGSQCLQDIQKTPFQNEERKPSDCQNSDFNLFESNVYDEVDNFINTNNNSERKDFILMNNFTFFG